MNKGDARREFLRASAVMGAGLLLSGCAGPTKPTGPTEDKDNELGGEVTATEDLMREPGVLRRTLLVYTAVAGKLRTSASSVPPEILQKTAKLFRAFGEDYHEKKLEEAVILPAVKKAGGPAAALADVLLVQHTRGREITDHLVAVTAGAKFWVASAPERAKMLDAFVLIYQHHRSRFEFNALCLPPFAEIHI